MKEKLSCLLSIFAVVSCVGGCPFMGRVYEKDLGNGYAIWATDRKEDAKIVKKGERGSASTRIIQPSVFAYGWNDDFIIAKQHPEKEGKTDEYDYSLTYWYILEVKSGDVHGPLSEDEFNKLRTELNVPSEIKFKTVK